jgi:hypothetical protein
MDSTVAPSCIALGLEFLSPVDRVSVQTEENVISPRKLSSQYLELGMITVLHPFEYVRHIYPAVRRHIKCVFENTALK